jgi:hypothetical protein
MVSDRTIVRIIEVLQELVPPCSKQFLIWGVSTCGNQTGGQPRRPKTSMEEKAVIPPGTVTVSRVTSDGILTKGVGLDGDKIWVQQLLQAFDLDMFEDFKL